MAMPPRDDIPRWLSNNQQKNEYLKKVRAETRDVGMHPPMMEEDIELKLRLKEELLLFCTRMFPNIFYLELSQDHLDVIENLERCIKGGGIYVQAMPRGSGKTSITICAVLWAILNGWRKYILVVAADKEAAESILSTITEELEGNDELMRFYPEACHYFRALEGNVVRARHQMVEGEESRIVYKKDRLRMARYPDADEEIEWCAESIIEARGLTGRVRGANIRMEDGSILRPDFCTVDDPQTAESAKSMSQIAFREKLILQDVFCTSGPGKRRMSGVMQCTVIQDGDLSDRFLKRYASKRAKMVYKWPSKKEGKEMWEQYIQLRRKHLKTGNEDKICNSFYIDNRSIMDEGAVVGWPQRYNENEISAIQSAYNIIAEIGTDAFEAEYQNQPRSQASDSVYTLSPIDVASSVHQETRGTIPECVRRTVIGIDVNNYALSWAFVGSPLYLSSYVMDYQKYTGDGSQKILWTPKSGASIETVLSNELINLINKLVDKYHPHMVVVDGNYMTKIVQAVVKMMDAKVGPRIIVGRGTPSERYRSPNALNADKVCNRCHLTKESGEIWFDSHFWHMHTQKGFLLNPGAAGATSIFDKANHRMYSEEVCSEKLLDHYVRNGIEKYTWSTIGKNDLFDATVMAVVGLHMMGANFSGTPVVVKKQNKRARRKPRRPIED